MTINERHFMTDIETLGTEVDSVITSIGICEFDIKTGNILDEYYRTLNWQYQVPQRQIYTNTLLWWFDPKRNSQANTLVPTSDSVNLRSALIGLKKFVDDKRSEVWSDNKHYFWSKGNFDYPILAHAFQQEYQFENNKLLIIPWNFRFMMDMRTLIFMVKQKDPTFSEFSNDPDSVHHALSDAKHQAGKVCEMYQILMK